MSRKYEIWVDPFAEVSPLQSCRVFWAPFSGRNEINDLHPGRLTAGNLKISLLGKGKHHLPNPSCLYVPLLIFGGVYMDVSKNRAIPQKWMVKRMENPIKMDDLGGNPTIFRNIHI